MGAAAASPYLAVPSLAWFHVHPSEGVDAERPRQHAGRHGQGKRTFGFIKDSFKNMQGGMLADSSFLKNIFYFRNTKRT